MTNLRLDFFVKLGLLFLLALPSMVFSQITITSQDFLNLIGTREVVLQEESSSTTVNVGAPGANVTWDFSGIVLNDTVVAVTEFLAPNQTVSASTFPDANFVEKISKPDAPGFSIFQFYNFTPNDFINLGDSTFFAMGTPSGNDTSFVSIQNDTLAPLPLAFNNSWMSVERNSTGFLPAFGNVSIDTTMNVIDGWGTVRIPLGDFQCLRLRQDVKAINQTIANGQVISSSMETYIQYNWIGHESFQFLNIQSQDGETLPNFTNAREVAVLDTTTASPPTSVDEFTGIPSGFELAQNYPNPFNPETLIKYQTTESSRVELAIYNLLGQKVRVLLNETKPAGSYEARWDGTNDFGEVVSSGVYVYRLQSGEFASTKKMIFLQ